MSKFFVFFILFCPIYVFAQVVNAPSPVGVSGGTPTDAFNLSISIRDPSVCTVQQLVRLQPFLVCENEVIAG